MSKHGFARITLALAFLASSALAQDAPAFDPETCAKHCREMAAARAKSADAWKARMQQREAAWKEIQAQLELARASRGEKKLAALESAIEKLVAYEASESDGAMKGGAEMRAAGCCPESPAGCCGHHGGAGHRAHCPMMQGGAGPKSAP